MTNGKRNKGSKKDSTKPKSKTSDRKRKGQSRKAKISNPQRVFVVPQQQARAKAARKLLRANTREMHVKSREMLNTIGSTVSTSVKRIAASALLPYEGPLLRIRAGQTTSVATSSAITRNHVFYDIDLNLEMVEDKLTGTVGNRDVWENNNTQYTIVNILDARLMGIVPHLYTHAAPVGSQIYRCNRFMNPNQSTIGTLHFTPPSNLFNMMTTTRCLGSNPDDIYWLDPVDLLPPSLNNIAYGDIHPCLDGPSGRYFWIDARDQPNGADMVNVSSVQIALEANAIWCLEQLPDDEMASRLKLIVESINHTADPTDVTRFTASFTPGASPVLAGTYPYAAMVRVMESGYYRVGLSGEFTSNVTAGGAGYKSDQPLIITNLNLDYTLDRRITVVSKHIINPNLSAVSTNGAFNFFDTIQTNSGSCLVKNSTPNLFKGGMVWGTTNEADKDWYNFTSNTTLVKDSYGDSLLKYNGLWEKGAYGWLRNAHYGFRPGVEVTTADDGTTLSAIRSYSLTRMTDKEGAKFRAMNIYNLTPTEAYASSVRTTLLFTVQYEYTTLSQVPQQTTKAENELNSALIVLQSAPTFTENPLHISGFMNLIRTAGRNILDFYKDNRKVAVPVFNALSSFGGPIASMIGNGLSALDGLIGE